MPPPRRPLQPDRLRTIERPFGWLPCRLLTGGMLARMSGPARQLYLLLALAADRRGLSFYGDRHIQQTLGLDPDELEDARAELIAVDLLAFEDGTYQLLSWPTASRRRPAAPAPADDAPVVRSSPKEPHGPPASPTPRVPLRVSDETRQTLRRLFGHDFGV